MESELNPITVAALLARMITLQYPEFNISGDVMVSEIERKLAKKLFKIMVNMVADAKETRQSQQGDQKIMSTSTTMGIKKEPNDSVHSSSPKAKPTTAATAIKFPDNNKGPEKSKELTIKREVEEFHISNINLQKNYRSEDSSQNSSQKLVMEEHLGNRSTETTEVTSKREVVVVPSASKPQVSLTNTSNSEKSDLNTSQNAPSVSPALNDRTKSFLESAGKVLPSLTNDSVKSSNNKLNSEFLKGQEDKTKKPPRTDDQEIICLDLSDDEDAPKAVEIIPKDAKVDDVSVIFVTKNRSNDSDVVNRSKGSVASSHRCKKSRLDLQDMWTEEEQRTEAKIQSFKDALTIESFTLDEFTKARKENRTVLGGNIRRWATLRASVIADFEYQLGEEWVKYFVNKYKISFDKRIGSLVFQNERDLNPNPPFAVNKRKNVKIKNSH